MAKRKWKRIRLADLKAEIERLEIENLYSQAQTEAEAPEKQQSGQDGQQTTPLTGP
ncbi:MAG: hypothetical protein ACLFUU_13985 [Desulfobacteraceae bacterium]